MLPSKTLEALDSICKAFKRSDAPFGGLQVVLCGDFFQLPPVSRNGEEVDFIYKSTLWKELDLQICYLDKPYRQEDATFLHLLSQIRTNTITKQTWGNIKTPIFPRFYQWRYANKALYA
jgi:ATP-dependent DNA helicase PIF1